MNYNTVTLTIRLEGRYQINIGKSKSITLILIGILFIIFHKRLKKGSESDIYLIILGLVLAGLGIFFYILQ